MKRVEWFTPSGQRNVVRHSLNDRQQQQVLATYRQSVKDKGIVLGVRGAAWLQQPNLELGESSYKALTFATLSVPQCLVASLRLFCFHVSRHRMQHVLVLSGCTQVVIITCAM